MPRLFGISQNLISTKNKETKTSNVIGSRQSAVHHVILKNRTKQANMPMTPDSEGQYRARGSHRRLAELSHTHSLSFLFIF